MRKQIDKILAILREVETTISDLPNEIESLADAEREKHENLSENMSGTEQCQRLEESAGALEVATCALESAVSELESTIQNLESALDI